jgi:hypothetical protein
MTEEQLIHLAKQIADNLPKVTRNDWLRWAQLADRYGLERAVQWAQRMSSDVTLRPQVNKANDLIARSMQTHIGSVKQLPPPQQKKLMGYVARMLAVQTRQSPA